MDVSKSELAARFRDMSDEELQQLVSDGNLTELAIEVATTELESRGLRAAPEANDSAGGLEAEGLPDESLDLVTVIHVPNSLEGSVLRALLEQHGIFAYLWGEHARIALDGWTPPQFWPRLQVRSDQVEQAKEVIAAFQRGEFALDKDPE